MKEEIIECLKNDTDTLRTMVCDCNGWNGSLDWLDYYENDEYFFNDFFPGKVDDAVRAVCYGNYNYMDDYVHFNAYGNLESCSEFEYQQELEDNAEEIFDNWYELYQENNVDINYLDNDEFKELLEKYESEEEDNE